MATPPASEETQIAFGDFTARQQPGPNTLSLPADYVGREAEVRFGKTNVPNVNLRVQPQTNANRVDKLHEKDMTVMILDSVVDSDGTDWYLVWHVSRKAYVKAEFIDIINEEAFWALH